MLEKTQVVAPTLRDVAQAALALDADGGREPVSWGALVEKARDLAARRHLATTPHSPEREAVDG